MGNDSLFFLVKKDDMKQDLPEYVINE